MGTIRRGRWTNWAGNQTARPASIENPATEADVVRIVERAAERGTRVKAVGTGHSFTSTALTDEIGRAHV